MKKTLFLTMLVLAPLYNSFGQETPAEVIPPVSTTGDVTEDLQHYSDPFSPISQFDPDQIDEEEEVTERFYDFGRLVHISLGGGIAQPTGPMVNIYNVGWMIGTRFTYFLDWDLGITFHANIGRSSMSIINPNPITYNIVPEFTGTATLFNMGLGVKFYPNFYDISKSIAWLNPSILIGMEVFMINDRINEQDLEDLKTYNINDPSHRATAPSVFMGAGVDIPFLRNVLYLGLEFIYHLSFFPSTNYRIDANDPHFGQLDYSGRFFTYNVQFIWNI
jgi:hypothetical protein